MLEIHNVHLTRSNIFSIELKSLHVAKGERVTIIGPSGSGKSTLLRIVAGLEVLEGGEVRVNGTLVSGSALHVRELSLLSQDLGLWPHLSAAQHLAFVRNRGRSIQVLEPDRELLGLVGLANQSDTCPGSLSGGQQQRLALARTLVRRPKLLLLDEPFSNVDPVLAGELLQLLDDIHTQWGLTRIQVSHWTPWTQRRAERFIVLEEGRIQQDGAWDFLCRNPASPWIQRFASLAH